MKNLTIVVFVISAQMFFIAQSIFGMEENIKKNWQNNISLAFALMKESNENKVAVPYRDENTGELTLFDAPAQTVQTVFSGGATCQMSYLRFLLLIEENDTADVRYLRDGVLYDGEGNTIGDFSIEAMHEKEEKNKNLGRIKKIFTLPKKLIQRRY